MTNFSDIFKLPPEKLTGALPFGKRKGKRLWELDDYYLAYICKTQGQTITKVSEIIRQAQEAHEAQKNFAESLEPLNIEAAKKSGKLYPYQIEFLEFMRTRTFALLSSYIGSGKTRMALSWYALRRRQGEKLLVFCPLSVIGGWLDEVKKFLPQNVKAIGVSGVTRSKLLLLDSDADIYVTNYQAVTNDEVYARLQDIQFDFIFVDESHNIKNHKQKSSGGEFAKGRETYAYRITELKSKYRLAITGTPISKDEASIFNQAKFLDGGETFGTSFSQFYNDYFFRGNYGYYGGAFKEFARPKFVKNLASLSYHVERTKHDTLQEPQRMTRRIELTGENKTKYIEILHEAYTQIEQTEVVAEHKLTELVRLRQICGGGVGGAFVESNKLNALLEFVKETDEKIVVACAFADEARRIIEAIKKDGKKSVGIYGDMTADEIEKSKSEFVKGDADVLVLTIQKGGTGLDGLQYASRIMVFYSNTYRELERVQAEGRIYRTGQQYQCLFVDLLSYVTSSTGHEVDCYDNDVLAVVQGKQELIDRTISAVKAAIEKLK